MQRRSQYRRFSLLGLLTLTCFLSNIATAYELRYGKNGEPMRWAESCAYYSIHQEGAPGLDFGRVQETIRRAFDKWEDVPCSYFFFEETEPSSCKELGLNLEHGNINALYWVLDNWEIDVDHMKGAVALTTVSWDNNTGKIYDADIEFNSEYFKFSLDGEPLKADLENTATHEIGHFLGLQHSFDSEATMFGQAESGETGKRTLEPDDIEGLCGLYPLDEDPDVCLLPLCGLDLDCSSTSCGSRKENGSTGTGNGCDVGKTGFQLNRDLWRGILSLIFS